jgi:SAM-dependent methyltransferase
MSVRPGDRDAVIARAMDTFPEAVPYLADLCADFDALGSLVSIALSMLDEAGVKPGVALDFGCGKGAHAVALAERGWRVRGVDLHEPFIAEAHRRAVDAGVERQCEFEESDLIEEAARVSAESLDLALLMSIGRPWGSLGGTIDALRRVVRPGGWVQFDDAVLTDDHSAPPEYEGYAVLEATERTLTAHGDTVIVRRLPNAESERAQHEQEMDWLRRRGEALIAHSPEAEPIVRRFLVLQEDAYEDLASSVRGVTWLLRRCD